jgi:hypothetical protein
MSSPRPAAVCLTALLATAGLTACGTEKVSESDAAKQVRTEALAPKGITGARVTCPSDTEAKKGATIRCSVADSDSNKAVVVVPILDDKGKLGVPKGDTADMQRAVIERNATAKAKTQGASGAVKCGEGTKPRKGAIYICTAPTRSSGTAAVLVTQKDERGQVNVLVRQKRLTTAKIQRQIAAQYKKQVDITVKVKCPSRVKSRIGATFTCTVTNPANGKSQTIVATQRDTEGNFALKVR